MILFVWTLSAAVLAFTGAYGVREAVLDLQALLVGNGVRLLAQQRLFAQAIRMLVGLGWVLLGVIVWLGDAGEVQLTPFTTILILGNFGFTAVAVSDVVVGRIIRHRVAKTAELAVRSEGLRDLADRSDNGSPQTEGEPK